MSFTIVDDNGTLQVRASIFEREELDRIIESLERHRERFKTEAQEKKPND